MHLWLLVKDAWHTKNRKDKFRIWVMPTGWRPADVAEKYPVHKIEDVYNFEKYATRSSPSFIAWTWIQTGILLLILSYFFAHIAQIGSPGMFIYGGFIFLFVYAFTELMDHHPYAWIWEMAKTLYGAGILYYLGDWFGISKYATAANTVFIVYFILSGLATFYFLLREKGEERGKGVIA